MLIVLFLSPDPSDMLSVNNGVRYVKMLAIYGVPGNVVAFQSLIMVSTAGIGMFIVTTHSALVVIKMMAAFYLCYLAVKTYMAPLPGVVFQDIGQCRQQRRIVIFREAFLIICLNPKTLLFVAALLPRFMSETGTVVPQLSAFCAISALIHFMIYFGYAALAEQLQEMCKKAWISVTHQQIKRCYPGDIWLANDFIEEYVCSARMSFVW